jgi:hypothetical protein
MVIVIVKHILSPSNGRDKPGPELVTSETTLGALYRYMLQKMFNV